ncbi:MAG TPA: hypothetical protein VL749_07690 [Patescibacteria group bacterium]|jgi:hypothetical protein|nr:hypothetical protein [Patescibacteria group bacterium]
MSDRPDDATAARPRTRLERLALAGIAVVVAAVFGGMGIAALAGGEVFLGVMGGIGALMTIWAAAGNLRRG